MKFTFVPVFLSIGLLLSPAVVSAGWQLDGTSISTAKYNQGNPTIASDGAGGAIMTWIDYRSGGEDIYAQRINATGSVQWTVDGVALCTAPGPQEQSMIVSDGSGGAIVTWMDVRSGTSYDIYAQRINAAGVAQWTANGVAVSTAASDQGMPTIASDGAGGAIVTWLDLRNFSDYDIYAQRINAAGAVQWTADGVALSTATDSQYYPMIASDGAGGAVVTWTDFRSGAGHIYAQRINAAGAVQWTANGAPLCTAAPDQSVPALISDGSGGAIVTWTDYRGGGDIYAQRINAWGAIQWPVDGVPLCTAASDQYMPTIASDGAGGAIVTWRDFRNLGNYDIYAQRINATGTVQWTADGVPLSAAANHQVRPMIESDGAGGAIVTWYDYRSGTNHDIYAQRITAAGTVQWTADGVALSTAVSEQFDPTIVSDGAGGAIVAWYEYRGGSNSDIYAQRVESTYGFWGHPEPVLASVADIPNDQGGKVAVNWTASGRDIPLPATIDYYSVWRAVDSASLTARTGASVALVPLDHVKADAAPGIFTTLPSSPYYWELVGTETAFRWSNYSLSAPTRSDSLLNSPGIETFMVAAHYLYDEHIAFPSNIMSGYSVDNLAPSAPLLLTAQRVGGDVHLKWNGVHVRDLKQYSVYRASSSGVTPIPVNFLANNIDTLLVDAAAPGNALYYIVTARDVHENQSRPSNEASVAATTGIGHTPRVTTLTVRPNYPNPFSGTTELAVGLPARSDVTLEMYDVAGRRVRQSVAPGQTAGWSTLHIDGRDDTGKLLPSGVYFFKVSAGAETITRKMVIMR